MEKAVFRGALQMFIDSIVFRASFASCDEACLRGNCLLSSRDLVNPAIQLARNDLVSTLRLDW